VTVALATVAGFLAGRMVWVAGRQALNHSSLARRNYRDRLVATAGGLVVALAVLVVEGGRAVVGAAGFGAETPTAIRLGVVLAVVTFALLGLVDDLVPDSTARGFRGHLGALLEGQLTTGGMKLAAGAAAALVLASIVRPGDHVWGLVRDGLVIALAANLANLLDRAPGRMLKCSAAAFVALVVAAGGAAVVGAVAVAVGAGLALVLDDLHERVMLGDTGSNAIGAALGIGAVAAFSPGVRTVIAGGLILMNVASEVVSFGRVIEAVPPLRALDRAGRRA
jgi:UDP-N-acetylmuramyl pentapeptide phosphotransferase/UDP-N-acetylglucosamine-1-phosphate transferase